MPVWGAASAAFFLYVAVAAFAVRGLTRRARTLAVAGSTAGLAIAVATGLPPAIPLLQDWLVPPALLLLGYWTSGLLFAAPMPRVEAVLAGIDRWLGVERTARMLPRWLGEVLEIAYAGVYPLVPLALVIRVLTVVPADPGRFWAVILITDFICFACLAWIQTRPPRALHAPEPWDTPVRRLNLRLLGSTSIQVNTFPSGHAAEAVAAALLVSAAPWPIAAAMAVGAALVSAGTVFGRYHYAADAIAGWIVAAVVWALIG